MLAVLVLLAVGIGPWTGRYQVITVLSGSMTPTYPVGSLILSTPQSMTSTEVSQVVTFHAPVAGATVVTHRIIQLKRVGGAISVRTQGDANPTADPWLARMDHGPVWRATFVVPHAGDLIRLLRRPGVHSVTVLVVPAIFAVIALMTIWTPNGRLPRRRVRAPNAAPAS